jgi:hypothetical protein
MSHCLTSFYCLPPLEALVMVESAYIRRDITLDYLRRRLLGNRTETQVWNDCLAFHLEPRQFKRDRRRDNEAIRQGMLVLRFFHDDIVYSPENRLRHVREVLVRGPARTWSDQPSLGWLSWHRGP